MEVSPKLANMEFPTVTHQQSWMPKHCTEETAHKSDESLLQTEMSPKLTNMEFPTVTHPAMLDANALLQKKHANQINVSSNGGVAEVNDHETSTSNPTTMLDANALLQKKQHTNQMDVSSNAGVASARTSN